MNASEAEIRVRTCLDCCTVRSWQHRGAPVYSVTVPCGPFGAWTMLGGMHPTQEAAWLAAAGYLARKATRTAREEGKPPCVDCGRGPMHGRGLCCACYARYQKAVSQGLTTWQEIQQAGRCLALRVNRASGRER